MKKSAFTLLAFLAITGVTLASVTLTLVPSTVPAGANLESYTLQATGIGITTLSQFTVTTAVNQVWTDTGDPNFILIPSPWLGDGSATGLADDSYVIFGDQIVKGAGANAVTVETYPGYSPGEGDTGGPGTLNNYSGSSWDAYFQSGTPGTTSQTVDLLQLVVADTVLDTDIELTVRLVTATSYDSVTGDSVSTVYNLDETDIVWGGGLEGGDTNGDTFIDGIDLGNFADGWFGPEGAGNNGTSSALASWETGDFDGSVFVDGIDLGIFADGWFGPNGAGFTGVAGVPEPSTIVMLILGALCLVGYRVRK